MEYKALNAQIEGKVSEMEKKADEMGEKIKGLESERDALKEAMTSEEFKHKAHDAEEIARLRGEVEVLKEKLANAELRSAAFGEKSAEDVGELERQVGGERAIYNVRGDHQQTTSQSFLLVASLAAA